MSLVNTCKAAAGAVVLLAGSSAMAASTLPSFGHFSAFGIVQSLTSNSGADCQAYSQAGSVLTGYLTLNQNSQNMPIQNLRLFGAYGYVPVVWQYNLAMTSGTQANQSGNVQVLADGAVAIKLKTVSYSATESAIDGNSFTANISVTFPGDTSAGGTCTSVIDFAYIRTGTVAGGG